MIPKSRRLSTWALVCILAGTWHSALAADNSDQSGFSMKVMDAFKVSGRGVVLTGAIERGSVRVGDSVCLTTVKAGQQTSTVKAILLKQSESEEASAGDMPGILFDDIDRKNITIRGTDRLSATCSD